MTRTPRFALRKGLLLALFLTLSSVAHAGEGLAPVQKAGDQPTSPAEVVSGHLVSPGANPAGTNDSPRRQGKFVRASGKAVRALGGGADRAGDWLNQKGDRLAQKPGLQGRMGKMVRGSGKTLKLLLGTETLLNTSFEIGGGISLASPRLTRFLNVNTGAALWSGSVAYHEKGIKDVMVNSWLSMDCPMGGAGYSRLGKFGVSVSGLPLVSGYKSQRSHAVYVGVGGAAEMGIGEVGPGTNSAGQPVPARGPYMEGYLSIPVLPLGAVNAYAGVVFTFYSPALQPITKHMKKPADWLHKQGQKYQKAVAQKTAPLRRLGQKIKKQRWVKSVQATAQCGARCFARAKQALRPGKGNTSASASGRPL